MSFSLRPVSVRASSMAFLIFYRFKAAKFSFKTSRCTLTVAGAVHFDQHPHRLDLSRLFNDKYHAKIDGQIFLQA